MDWLLEQYKRVEDNLLKSLFKPWPSFTSGSENGDKEHKSAPRAEVPEDKAKSNEAPQLTTEEVESLKLVDKLLQKAQKARDVQKQLAEPKRPKPRELSVKPENEAAGLNSRDLSVLTKTAESSKLGKKNTDGKTNHRMSGAQCIQGITAVRQAEAGKSEDSSGAKTVEKSTRARISERPKSSSGNRKVVPAHVSAPFQTDARLASGKLQTTYRAANAKTVSKSRGAKYSADIQKRKEIKGGLDKGAISESETRGTSQSPRADCVKEENCDDEGNSSLNNSVNRCNKNGDKVSCDNTDIVQETFQKLAVKDGDRAEEKNSSQSEGNEETKLFCLAKDGTHLTIPGKLKKTLYQNRKLHEKLYTQNVTQKVDSPQTVTSFPEHLDHAFGDEETRLVQLQARQARHVLQTYTVLSDLLSSLHLEQISVESDPADVYHAKRLMEYILTTFQEMEEKLHTSDFRALSTAVVYRGSIRPKIPVVEPRNTSVWYDRQSLTAFSSPATTVKYKSYRELERYMNALYQVQLLQLQCDVIDTMSRSLMPLLQSLDPASSEFAQVLRMGYSLVSINRNNMPVVVRDTIQDESMLETEEQQ